MWYGRLPCFMQQADYLAYSRAGKCNFVTSCIDNQENMTCSGLWHKVCKYIGEHGKQKPRTH